MDTKKQYTLQLNEAEAGFIALATAGFMTDHYRDDATGVLHGLALAILKKLGSIVKDGDVRLAVSAYLLGHPQWVADMEGGAEDGE